MVFVLEDGGPGHVVHVLLLGHHEDVLGLDVGVDDPALGVEVGQALQDLLDDHLHVQQGDPLVVALNDELEQVVTEDLEDHADVDTMRTVDHEVVHQLDRLVSPRITGVRVTNLGREDSFYRYM